MLRNLRNELLQESDWVGVRALEASLSNGSIPSIPLEWKTYRQELRDITKTSARIGCVQWQMRPLRSVDELILQVEFFIDALPPIEIESAPPVVNALLSP